MSDDNKYYDEVDEDAYAQSRKNVSEPDPRSRDLWQSTTISTDDTGPTVDQVAPVFAQARADALANPVGPDTELDEDARAAGAEAAEAAQEKADAIRESAGFVAPTGADAGVYDDAKLEGQVPSENFSAAPEADEDERSAADAAVDEKRANESGSVYTDDGSVGNSDVNGVEVSSDDKKDELANDQAPSFSESNPAPNTNTEATPQESTPEAPTSNDGDTTHDDLVSDTAVEQGGLDETSAPAATPKRGRK